VSNNAEKSCSGSEESSSDSDTESSAMGAQGDHKERDIIMPWHIQETGPRQTREGGKGLIVELDPQDVAAWTAKRGTNCAI
jgi:hypothetical protein